MSFIELLLLMVLFPVLIIMGIAAAGIGMAVLAMVFEWAMGTIAQIARYMRGNG